MEQPIIACMQTDMGYGRRVVLPDVTLAIDQGEIAGILGPNGAGKTTLLKTILGIIAPLRGAVAFPRGRDRVRFGYVPQRQVVDESYPLTVGEVVLMGRYGRLGAGRRPRRADHEAVACALDEVGLSHLSPQAYRELSGGQKQRVLIARALVGEPTVLVLDEPTTDMDLGSERAMLELITRLQQAHRLTILLVSHILPVVLTLATTVVLVNGTVRTVPAAIARQPGCLSAFYGVPVQVAAFGGRYLAV